MTIYGSSSNRLQFLCLIRKMAGKFKFPPLKSNGENYLSWRIDAELMLESKDLLDTLGFPNLATNEQRAKANTILRQHIHESLKNQFLVERDPHVIWASLEERFNRLQNVLRPKAEYDWNNLRYQDFKSVDEFTSRIYEIVSIKTACGLVTTDQQMIEKTLSTFHPNHMLLSQQYRTMQFERFAMLQEQLKLSEEQNNTLIRAHNARPTGSAPVPLVMEANAAFARRNSNNHGRGRGPYNANRGGGRQNFGRGRGHGPNNLGPRRNQNRGRSSSRGRNKNQSNNSRNGRDEICFRCGTPGHWATDCRTPKYLADLYQATQASRKGKGITVETNFASTSQNPPVVNVDSIWQAFEAQPQNQVPPNGEGNNDVPMIDYN